MTEHVTQQDLERIAKEVKGYGDDTKKIVDGLNTNLEAVRKIAEEAKAGVERPEIKHEVDRLKKLVEEAVSVFEVGQKATGDRMDKIVTALGRPGLDTTQLGAWGEGEAKSAFEFHKTTLARKGELKVGVDASKSFNPADVKAYIPAFEAYLRKGEQMLGIPGGEVKALSVGSDPDGGYFVTPQIMQRVLALQVETSPLRGMATVETISTDAAEYPVDDNLASGGWVGEQASRTETNTPQIGVQRIPVHELYASPKSTQKLLEDAAVNVESWLGGKVGQYFALTEATAFISGTGVNQPRGILSYTTSGLTRGTIEQVVSGNATALTFDGLINLQNAMFDAFLNGASWLMRRATVGALLLLKDGDGQYLWRPSLQVGAPSVLLGYPVNWAADMPAVAASAFPVAFGNFREAYTIVDRLGITTLRDPFTAKPFVIFYSRKRVGGDVTNFQAIKLQKVST